MIGILDYGAGNIKSVQNSLDRLEVKYFVSDDPKKLETADKIIFPGVGNAKPTMKILKEKKLDHFLCSTNKFVLGICLGMQLLLEHSEEGDTNCLGIIPGEVKKFDIEKVSKVPHMGWNKAEDEYVYFVHSYYVPISEYTSGICTYENHEFAASIQYKNFTGMQFHPEKSGKAGEQLLQNFLNK